MVLALVLPLWLDSLAGPVLTLTQRELEDIADNIVAGMKEGLPELKAKKWICMPEL